MAIEVLIKPGKLMQMSHAIGCHCPGDSSFRRLYVASEIG